MLQKKTFLAIPFFIIALSFLFTLLSALWYAHQAQAPVFLAAEQRIFLYEEKRLERLIME